MSDSIRCVHRYGGPPLRVARRSFLLLMRKYISMLVALALLALAGCGEDEGVVPAEVRYLEVAASDYKLELVPEFDPMITSYAAQANGPGIVVYVDVIVDRDVESVLVNEVPAQLSGYRTWRSTPETDLIAPTSAMIELVDGSDAPARYEIAITVP